VPGVGGVEAWVEKPLGISHTIDLLHLQVCTRLTESGVQVLSGEDVLATHHHSHPRGTLIHFVVRVSLGQEADKYTSREEPCTHTHTSTISPRLGWVVTKININTTFGTPPKEVDNVAVLVFAEAIIQLQAENRRELPHDSLGLSS
jgi:hypothetical protein